MNLHEHMRDGERRERGTAGKLVLPGISPARVRRVVARDVIQQTVLFLVAEDIYSMARILDMAAEMFGKPEGGGFLLIETAMAAGFPDDGDGEDSYQDDSLPGWKGLRWQQAFLAARPALEQSA